MKYWSYSHFCTHKKYPDVIIGEKCVLQNFVVSRGCTIGDNCNLKDNQIEPQLSLKKGTKATKEGFVS